MLIVMDHDATDQEIEAVVNTINLSGFSARTNQGRSACCHRSAS